MANGGFAPNRESTFHKDFGRRRWSCSSSTTSRSRATPSAPGGDKGGVDIMWSTVDAYALEYGGLQALKPKAILQYDWSRGGDAIAVDGSIKTVADLRGKKLACAEETPSHYFALYALTQGGLTNRDVEWVFTTSAVEAANVFKAGRVDAAVSWSPDVYIAARERPGAQDPGQHAEASQPHRRHLRGPRRLHGALPRGRPALRGRLAEGRRDWRTPTPTRPRPFSPRASPASASKTPRACCRT